MICFYATLSYAFFKETKNDVSISELLTRPKGAFDVSASEQVT